MSAQSAKNKAVIDLSIEERTQFFSLYNTFKSKEEGDDRAKACWAFLCFVYKHLGHKMLIYFAREFFDEKMSDIIAMMVMTKAFIQPTL